MALLIKITKRHPNLTTNVTINLLNEMKFNIPYSPKYKHPVLSLFLRRCLNLKCRKANLSSILRWTILKKLKSTKRIVFPHDYFVTGKLKVKFCCFKLKWIFVCIYVSDIVLFWSQRGG